ncbi:hypothetical protein PIB30_108856 [Stylosanthes scabra]|uniref:Putative plant transposon protein domain-containing protein n=1 Tax=Stylosanthes scabra TaxID=79078 RepID=A0ABU6ZYB9_9FABA|nr:hypothetical protein [Stylosanthes scabra]
MVKEFYANAWEPDKAKRKQPTYTSSVRGTEVSFAPSNIKRVLRLKSDPYPNAPSYEERKANKDYRLEHILGDMCEEGAQWVCHRDGRPHYLRRSDLDPMSKGWYEFVCRSILPTTNRSELTVERAMLIHSIIIDENINVEEIIAEQIYKFVYKMDISSTLPFPSIIAALCADAKIRAIPNDTLIAQEQDKHHLPNNILNNTINNHPNSNNNKTFLVSILTLTPPCQTFKGGLTSNKRKIGEASRPSTQEWIEWMTN